MRLPSILGIDPGPEESAAVEVCGQKIVSSTNFNNDDFRKILTMINPKYVYIEAFQNYGNLMGTPSINTMYAIGEFRRICIDAGIPYRLPKRPEIKQHLCGTPRSNDATVRCALLRRYGKCETKGITTHLWAALAVASYGADWERLLS